MPLTKNATFRQLATFHAVARLGSVSAAADEMHLTQPAVSLQIAALEESARAPLLQRTGRGIRLTEAGQMLDGYARRILELWREAGEEMATLQGVFSGTLRVGAITTAEYLLPPMLVTFANEHPGVKVNLQVGNRDEIVDMLGSQEIDPAVLPRLDQVVAVDRRRDRNLGEPGGHELQQRHLSRRVLHGDPVGSEVVVGDAAFGVGRRVVEVGDEDLLGEGQRMTRTLTGGVDAVLEPLVHAADQVDRCGCCDGHLAVLLVGRRRSPLLGRRIQVQYMFPKSHAACAARRGEDGPVRNEPGTRRRRVCGDAATRLR